MSPHQQAVHVLPDDIDQMGHVNNAVHLKWVQEAGVGYWRRIAPAETISRHLWAALRHEIDYRRPAFLGDCIEATVVAEKVEGCRASFLTRALRSLARHRRSGTLRRP